MIAYHYTIADRLVKILIDGYIKTMRETSKLNETEPCLVWLTKNSSWDKTAFYGYPMEALDNAGRIRITLEGMYLNHHLFRHLIPQIDILEHTAREVGVNVDDWLVLEREIPMSEFKRIELWRDGKWVEIPIVRNVYDERADNSDHMERHNIAGTMNSPSTMQEQAYKKEHEDD